ncbi:hypothetical protein C6P45_004533 [Maudiozyma exigua]|uniref:Dolichyl-phosphate-mannose--protein mannosyltransferase n=1 Tax=Maudiozyma exigua TaxID=34358 RepID=A0A9P6WBS5_MAUEX|nr:hypothetical protein C6P45_004533 [Kazachstania exigua]
MLTSDISTEKKSDGGKIDRFVLNSSRLLTKDKPDSERIYVCYCVLVTSIALVTRLIKISFPTAVVFDEVHFGKFASLYLERRFFFDLHPPLARLFFGLIGYLAGYDGNFKFDYVGQDYFENDETLAPFLIYRISNALVGTLVVPLIFNCLKELNCYAVTCLFGSLLFALDNAQICQTRYIFLDPLLLLSIIATIYCYIRFYKYEIVTKKAFTYEWYKRLILVGISLSCAISCKYVGVMTYATIGIAVVFNICQLFVKLKGQRHRGYFVKHFVERLNYLVMLPFLIYLFWFFVHFQILIYDDNSESEFLSETFQDSLIPNESFITRYDQYEVRFYDNITIRHDFSDIFLCSSNNRSDQSSSVWGSLEDNETSVCVWQILPDIEENEIDSDTVVTLNDNIRFRNMDSGKILASVSVERKNVSNRFHMIDPCNVTSKIYENTLFTLFPLREVDSGHIVSSNKTAFKIFNLVEEATLFIDSDINNSTQRQHIYADNDMSKLSFAYNDWKIDEVVGVSNQREIEPFERKYQDYNFFSKWSELQKAMFMYNNDLSADHAFASNPLTWPLCLNGVLYWTKSEDRNQIYFIGNILAWWFEVFSMVLYVILVGVSVCLPKYIKKLLTKDTRETIRGPLALFIIGWACHYFPFFFMHRQKFLHHYLPAQMITCLFTAVFWESLILTSDNTKTELNKRRLAYCYMFILVPVISCFIFYAPIIYGWPTLEPEQIRQREWFNIQLNFK